jgi:carbonic anhydrase
MFDSSIPAIVQGNSIFPGNPGAVPDHQTVTDALVAEARRHQDRFDGPHPVEPAKRLAIVSCMDSRIDIFDLFGLGIGEAHVIRNAGGVVTNDTLRSLVLSQRALGTREIILVHHTDCGLQKVTEDEMQARIRADVGENAPYAFETFTDVDAAVRRSLRRVHEHRFLPHRDAARGFVYDVMTGELREVQPSD